MNASSTDYSDVTSDIQSSSDAKLRTKLMYSIILIFMHPFLRGQGTPHILFDYARSEALLSARFKCSYDVILGKPKGMY
jgi:hypothetical protein